MEYKFTQYVHRFIRVSLQPQTLIYLCLECQDYREAITLPADPKATPCNGYRERTMFGQR